MRRAPILMFSFVALLFGCGSSAQLPASPAPSAVPEQPATIYAPGNGGEIWHFQGNRQWSGFSGLHLNEAPLRYSRSAGVACVDLGGGSAFGAPDVLRVGTRFECGTARFEVVACEFANTCHIQAIWRTGVASNHSQVPANYFYSRCRGILSVTFEQGRPLRVGFGEALELRQGPGLLAQPDAPGCAAENELYGGPPAPNANKYGDKCTDTDVTPAARGMLMRRAPILILSLMISSMGAAIASQKDLGVYVYVKTGSNMADVYHLDQQRYARGFINRSGRIEEGDTGGAFRFCSDATFNCLESMLNVSVPTRGMPETWTHDVHRCRSRPVNARDGSHQFAVRCQSTGNNTSVDFIYSMARGIISYRRNCPGCPDDEFTIRGNRGLFAQSP